MRILAAWSSPALARAIDDPALRAATATASTATAAQQPRPAPPGEQHDWALPIALGGAAALLALGSAGYAYRTRTSHSAIA